MDNIDLRRSPAEGQTLDHRSCSKYRNHRQVSCRVSDPVLRDKLQPDYRLGCKRILISDDYLPAPAFAMPLLVAGFGDHRADAPLPQQRAVVSYAEYLARIRCDPSFQELFSMA
jgi:hypothetical protein